LGFGTLQPKWRVNMEERAGGPEKMRAHPRRGVKCSKADRRRVRGQEGYWGRAEGERTDQSA